MSLDAGETGWRSRPVAAAGRRDRRGVPGRRAVGWLHAMVVTAAVSGWSAGLAQQPAQPAAAAPVPAAVAGPDGVTAPDGEVIEFIRVRVPQGRLQDIPVGGERHVPLSGTEFDKALARSGATAARGHLPRSLPVSARYELRLDAAGSLVGRVVIEVQDAGPGRFIGLGAVRATGGSVRTARGVGAAVAFGMPDGGVALATPEPGTYACDIACPAPAAHDGIHRLPLVGGLTTVIVVEQVPAQSRLLVSAGAGRPLVRRIDGGATDASWQIDAGPVSAIEITIMDRDRPAPRVATWTRATVHGNAVGIATQFVPAAPWNGDELVVTKSPGLRPTAVRILGHDDPIEFRETDAGEGLRIGIPTAVQARFTPLVVEAVAPVELGREWAVPGFGLNAAAWGGGGIELTVDPTLVVEAVEPAGAGCRLVTPEVAGRWPLPASAAGTSVPMTADADPAARMAFEMQRHSGAPRVVLRGRAAQFDVARVTTVELTRERVVGRASCDVRVVAGQAFSIEGGIMQGWIIDSVEAVDLPAGRQPDAADRPRVAVADSRALEWVELPARSGVRPLRIALDAAISPARGVGLRITGHRAGFPDTGFETGDMDMVRLGGESADMAVIDFRPASEALVEIGGTPVGLFELDDRLRPLAEEAAPRGRIRGGDRATSRRAALVKRRPPLDAEVAIDVVVRDETVTQTFRFTGQANAAPLDSLVVHFSESMGDDLDWELLSPAGGRLVARRVEATDVAGPRERGAGESWLVELSPAVVGRVRVRASRALPGGDTLPLPLAWVEAAQRPGGTVLVRGEGTSRPGVRNRRLRELPPGVDAPAGTVAEFAFDEAERRSPAGTAAAEILATGADAEARAWAWHEESSVWCHDSGATEIETRFDIENHGRDAVTLTPLAGRQLLEVLIDGLPLDLPNLDAADASLRVPLPAGRSRLVLEIRALAAHVPRLGCWRIDTTCCTIDAPILDRRLRLLLPPELEAVTLGGRLREVGAMPRGLVERLFAVPSARAAAAAPVVAVDAEDRPANAAGSLVVGFRSRWFVPTTGAIDAVGIGIVRRRLLDASATVSAWLVLVAASVAARRSGSACIVLCAGLALLTLWMPAPFDLVTRAAWWAGVVGVLLAAWSRGLFRGRFAAGIAVGLAAVLPAATAVGGERAPLRVFVMPGTADDDVLVPERLFRLLAGAAADRDAGIRVVGCRIRADVAAADGPWTLELEVDADPGGRLVLDQRPCGGSWLQPAAGASPVTVGLEGGNGLARVMATSGGRHTVRLAVRPAVERRGDVEFIAACLPPAARAVLELVDEQGRTVRPAADAVQCDAARPGRPYLRVGGDAEQAVLDVSGATRVRLVRPTDRRDRLVTGSPREVRTLNEVSWNLDACGLQATFDIDPGAGLARSCVVATTPGLEAVSDPGGDAEPAYAVVPLGSGRHLVEFRQPRRGGARVRLGFRMPLVDPVGTFTVPEARVEGSLAEIHEVRLTAAADLDIDVETPAAAVPAPPADGEPLRNGWAWRTLRADGRPTADSWARLSVRRRPQEVRATQRLAVEFAADGVTLQLRAKLDALTLPLATLRVEVPDGFTVTRAAVVEDDVLGTDAAARGPLDIEWTAQADGLSIVVQRPRAGRFRLDVDASSTLPPPRRGSLPLLRAVRAGGAPLAVEWRQVIGAEEVVRHTAEVADDGPRPDYELVTSPLPAVQLPEVVLPKTATPPATRERQEGVLVARVHAAIDDAGRLRGVARFDILTGGGPVRLRLPAGTRLFDVLVDGREVQPVPAGADVWEIRLHDSLWPRAVAVVFGADVGPRGPAGQVRFAAPTIDGLRGRDVVWTIDPPPGAVVRVAGTTRPLDETSWRSVIAAGEARVVAAFAPVIAATPEPMRTRYRDFAATLAAGQASGLEASWDDALPRRGGSSGGRMHGMAAADGAMICRIEQTGDESLPSRIALSAALVAVIGLVRAAAVRRGRRAAAV